MFYNKKYTNFGKIDNYVEDYENYDQWCQYCVYFGDSRKNPYWLCAKHYPEISMVSNCGHCDRFSNTEKINLLKLCLLKMNGFQLKNKVR